jgi:hypothetical protein
MPGGRRVFGIPARRGLVDRFPRHYTGFCIEFPEKGRVLCFFCTRAVRRLDEAVTRHATTSVLLLWAIFLAFLLVQALWVAPIMWADSNAYVAVAKAPLLSLSFWAGGRPPFIPLIIKLVGSGRGFVLVQSAVSALAWGGLVWALRGYLRRSFTVVAAVVLFLFALSEPLTLWNNAILSESLALSSLVLLLASVLHACRSTTWWRISMVVLCGVLVASSRDTGISCVIFTGVVALGVSLVLWRRVGWRGWARRVGVLAGALLIVAGVGSAGVYSSHRSVANLDDVFTARVFSYPERVTWFGAHGMPCIRTLRGVAPARYGRVVIVPLGSLPYGCSTRLMAWIVRDGAVAYSLYLLEHPWYTITEPFAQPRLAYNYAQGDLYFYASAGRLNAPTAGIFWPGVKWLSFPLLLSGLLLVKTAWWGRRGTPGLLVALGFSGSGVVTMLLAWHGDAQETTRHVLEGLAGLRIELLVGFLLLIFGRRGVPGAMGDGATGGAGGGEESVS